MSLRFPYIFLGDSIFALWGNPFKYMTNLAVSGSATYHQKDYIAKPYGISHHGLILNVGSNDLGLNRTISDALSDYEKLIVYLKTITIKIYCNSVMPICKDKYIIHHGAGGHYKYSTPGRLDGINNGIMSLCSSYGCTFIDFRDEVVVNGEMNCGYTDDGIHPNALGYEAYKRVLLKNIEDLE